MSGFKHYMSLQSTTRLFEALDSHAQQEADKAAAEAAAAEAAAKAKEQGKEELPEDERMFEALAQTAVTNTRAAAMAGLSQWAQQGEPTADDLDAMAQGMSGIDEDDDSVDEGEVEDYNETAYAMAQAMVELGVDGETATAAMQGDDDAAAKAFNIVGEKLATSDEDETVAEFSLRKEAMTEAMEKVIRDGQVVWVKKKLKKKRMTAAQKAALKKARSKANTAAAKAKRARSMKKRDAAGLK